ncbi:MAG TPA: hypothetical protein VGI12_16890 [Vicinamibacterales bacterium]
MIEFADRVPDVGVQPAEYIRLLGYPRGWVLEGRARELADWAREWYAAHGRPWTYARMVDHLRLDGGVVVLDGARFHSSRLTATLAGAAADRAFLVAVGAGPELEAEAQVRWQDGKPDEYFFLEIYGSAVVEQLVTMTGARLCAWADGEHAAVLPHYSPGYPEWTIEEQGSLLDLIRAPQPSAVPLDAFETGMLRPKKSLLAVFGVTRHVERVRPLTELSPCESCSYAACQYRRAPYRRARRPAPSELPFVTDADVNPLSAGASYTVSVKALQRWSQERLTIETRGDGSVAAVFRYEGTTCTNMGRPLQFHYHVKLGRREDGYPILEQSCGPAAGDTGHLAMCRYISDRDELMAAIATESPLHGRPLDDVVRWARTASPAGCYCEAESRQHKWGLVLETIHFALAKHL